MIRGGERQLRTVDPEAPVLDIEQPARSPEVVQKVSVDMEKIRVFAHVSNDMLIPNFGQHRTARLSQGSPPFDLLRPAASAASRFPRLVFKAATALIKA